MGCCQEPIREGGAVPEWPYPVRYGRRREVAADVLVAGAGVDHWLAACTNPRPPAG